MFQRRVLYSIPLLLLVTVPACHKTAIETRPQTNAIVMMRTTTTVHHRGIRVTLERNLYGHTQYVFYLNFSPDNSLLASGSADCTVRIWNYKTGAELYRDKERYSEVWGIPLDYSQNGKYLVIGSFETLKVLDVANGYGVLSSIFDHKGGIQSLEVTPDSKQVVTVGVDGNLSVWSLPNLEPVSTIKAHSQEIWSVSINPGGTLVLTGAEDCTAKLWYYPSLELKKEIKYHSYPIEYVRFSRDGSKFLLASADGTISVWKTGQLNEPAAVLKGHLGSVLVAVFSADGQYVFSGGDDDDIYIFDADNGNIIDKLNEHLGDVMTLAVSPDGNYLASGSRDRNIKIWSIKYE